MSCSKSVTRTIQRLPHALLVISLPVLLEDFTPALMQEPSASERILRTVADAVIKDATFEFVDQKARIRVKSPADAPVDVQLHPESPYTDWRYWNGVINLGMIRLGHVIHEPAYVEFSAKNISFSFDHYHFFEERYKGEGKWSYPFGQRFVMEELDDCGAMGASVIEVYSRDRQSRYRAYIDQVARHMLKVQQRLEEGAFVRSFPRKWTLWADDLYMSVSFLARMGELSHEMRYYDDAARQVVEFHRHLFDEGAGLMHHCWYSDDKHPGVAFWGRANGWAMLAQIDLLDRLPKDHPKRGRLLELLRRHIRGVAQYQSKVGLWHQLLDRADSFLETSCTAMFTYAIARAVNKGYLERQYASIAQLGWQGIKSRIRPDGQIEGVCAGTGVSEKLDDYYRRPTPLNDVHGIGPVLLAGAEVLQLGK